MHVMIVAFTAKGCQTALRVKEALNNEDSCRLYAKTTADVPWMEKIAVPLVEWTGNAMASSDAIVFIGATGVAVRMIAPYVKDKKKDPAVVCMDENGRYVISLLSGHIGGANRLTSKIAKGIDGTPIITTATDVNGKFAVDVFAVENGMMFKGRALAKTVTARILDRKAVFFESEFPVEGKIPMELTESDGGDLGILVSSRFFPMLPFDKTLVLIPRHYVVGLGCRKDIPYENVRDLYCKTLRGMNIAFESVRVIASIDLKKEEPSLQMLSKEFNVPIVFYSAEELNNLENNGFSSSEMVRSVTGVDCVCERAAVNAARNGRLIRTKTKGDGVTIAVLQEDYKVFFGGRSE